MKKGLDAKITVLMSGGQHPVAGFATWTYSGETRELLAQVEFGVEFRQQEVGIFEGGDVALTGFYRVDEVDDPGEGQRQLKAWFQAGTKIYCDDIRLYLDEHVYLTPDATFLNQDGVTYSPASYLIITKFNDTGQDVAGVATFNLTGKVSGRMKEGVDA